MLRLPLRRAFRLSDFQTFRRSDLQAFRLSGFQCSDGARRATVRRSTASDANSGMQSFATNNCSRDASRTARARLLTEHGHGLANSITCTKRQAVVHLNSTSPSGRLRRRLRTVFPRPTQHATAKRPSAAARRTTSDRQSCRLSACQTPRRSDAQTCKLSGSGHCDDDDFVVAHGDDGGRSPCSASLVMRHPSKDYGLK